MAKYERVVLEIYAKAGDMDEVLSAITGVFEDGVEQEAFMDIHPTELTDDVPLDVEEIIGELDPAEGGPDGFR